MDARADLDMWLFPLEMIREEFAVPIKIYIYTYNIRRLKIVIGLENKHFFRTLLQSILVYNNNNNTRVRIFFFSNLQRDNSSIMYNYDCLYVFLRNVRRSDKSCHRRDED